MRQTAFVFIVAIILVAFSINLIPHSVIALEGARSATVDNNVFLGGAYIELGISSSGKFESTVDKPVNFFGTTVRNNIGMSSDVDGYNVGQDLRMDYFLPGSPEERWVYGFKENGNDHMGSNQGNEVADTTNGDNLSATISALVEWTLDIQQKISFKVNDKFFKNEVTIKNVSNATVNDVRFMRSFDPDNTVDQGGDYTTYNEVVARYEEDGKEAVQASNIGDPDPVFVATGSRTPILYFTNDSRARVSIFGFGNGDPYDPMAYDTPQAKNDPVEDDIAITITFALGDLGPEQSTTFYYYTSLDERDFDEVIADIEEQIQQQTNQPTVLVNNKTVQLNRGSNISIKNTNLFAQDPDNTASQIVYTLLSNTQSGALRKNGSVITAGATFTQEDINLGKLKYYNNPSSTAYSDKFTFSVADTLGVRISSATFTIKILDLQATANDVTPTPTPVEEEEDNDEVIIPVQGEVEKFTVKITDKNGTILKNTKVFIEELNIEVVTNDRGEIVLTNVKPGNYTYTVEIDNKKVTGSFTIEEGKTTNQNIKIDYVQPSNSVNIPLLFLCCLILIGLIGVLAFLYKKKSEEEEKEKKN